MQLPTIIIDTLEQRGYTIKQSATPAAFHKVTFEKVSFDLFTFTYIEITPDKRPDVYASVRVSTVTQNDTSGRTLLDRGYTYSDLPNFITDLSYLNF